MATLASQVIAQTGLGVAYAAAAAGGDRIPTGDSLFLHVKNAGAAAITVTLDAVRKCDQGVEHDLVVVVPIGGDRMVGPLPSARFASELDGLVAVAYSAVAAVTVAAVRL